jgi:hypothetical protein
MDLFFAYAKWSVQNSKKNSKCRRPRVNAKAMTAVAKMNGQNLGATGLRRGHYETRFLL